MTDNTKSGGFADDALGASDTTQGRASELKARAQDALNQGADQVRYQALQAKDYANQQFGQAQQVITDRIVERPLASALVALGAGVVLGMALRGGGRD
jgi:ElaB/YqjD/DUF883 family membrane-anchored ribosome-binding protein